MRVVSADPPRTEAEFDARLAELIPQTHERQSSLDGYKRKYRTQYRAIRSQFWGFVLLMVKSKVQAANNN